MTMRSKQWYTKTSRLEYSFAKSSIGRRSSDRVLTTRSSVRRPVESKFQIYLARTLQTLSSDRIRIKIFLRDDILAQIAGTQGFTALTHITARSANKLSWSEDQIL